MLPNSVVGGRIDCFTNLYSALFGLWPQIAAQTGGFFSGCVRIARVELTVYGRGTGRMAEAPSSEKIPKTRKPVHLDRAERVRGSLQLALRAAAWSSSVPASIFGRRHEQRPIEGGGLYGHVLRPHHPSQYNKKRLLFPRKQPAGTVVGAKRAPTATE